jgi:hypothetical protein
LAVLQENFPIQKAILYGSYAYGNPHDWSDIDLVVLSPAFRGVPYPERLECLAVLAWRAGVGDIEALGYTPEEFESASPLSLLGEVRERGITVYEADDKKSLEQKFISAKEKVNAYLAPYRVCLSEGQIIVDKTVDEHTLATHRYPDTVLVKSADVPESIIAHEWIHVVQGTLEYFQGFRLLYVLLAEGLAEFVTKELYPDHVVKYPTGYELIATLIANDSEVIGELLRLNHLSLIPEDVDTILASAYVPSYSRDLIARMADRIRDSIRTANEAGIDDPTFVTLGEEVRAWKFILNPQFDGIRDRLNEAIRAWFEGAET